jgi:hypothetical protein
LTKIARVERSFVLSTADVMAAMLLRRPHNNPIARLYAAIGGAFGRAHILGGLIGVNKIEHSLTSSSTRRWLVVKALNKGIITA